MVLTLSIIRSEKQRVSCIQGGEVLFFAELLLLLALLVVRVLLNHSVNSVDKDTDSQDSGKDGLNRN